MKLINNVKNKLGICECKGCFRRGYALIRIPFINLERHICKKHLKEITKDGTRV